MKCKTLILYILAFCLCLSNVQASHSSHSSHHHHRSLRQIVKNIEKTDTEILGIVTNNQTTNGQILTIVTDIQNTDNTILSTVTDIQTTDNEILSGVTDLQTTNGQILDLVTSIDEKQKSEFLIHASDIGTTGYVITAPGSYALADDVVFTPTAPEGAATAAFTGGNGTGAAVGQVLVSGGVVRGVAIEDIGTGYTTAPTVTITGAGTGATATAYLGSVGNISVTGSSGFTSLPTVTIAAPNEAGGAVATGYAILNATTGTIRLILEYPGFGYTTPPVVTVSGGGGTVASTSSTVVLTNSVTGIAVTDAGSGYPNTVVAAITIASSNVNLNLNNHILSQALSGQTSQYPFTIGILVPDNGATTKLQSIYINGDRAIIDGFSMYGVRIFANTYDIQLSNLTIKNCGVLASKALRPTIDYVPHTSFDSSVYGSPFGVGGLSIGETNLLGMGPTFFTETTGVQNRISSVLLDNVSCLENFFNGICCVNATDVSINNSHFDDTFSDEAGNLLATQPILYTPLVNGGNFVGAGGVYTTSNAQFPNIVNMTVSNTTFNNTLLNSASGISTATLAYGQTMNAGAYVNYSENLAFSNCQFDNTNSLIGTAASGSVTSGFVGSYIQDSTFTGCSYDNTQGIQVAYGCWLQGFDGLGDILPLSPINVSFFNCTANNTTQNANLQTPTPFVSTGTPARGFSFDYCKNLYLENCAARNTVCNGPLGTFGAAVGFKVQGGASPNFEADNLVFRGCVSFGTMAVNGGDAFGFELFSFNSSSATNYNLRSVVLEDCVAEGNIALTPSGTPLQTQGTGTGFYVINSGALGFPYSLSNCKALHNKGANFNAATASYSAGFYLKGNNATTQLVTNSDLYNCEALDNIYGVFLQNSKFCSIRNCRADYNTNGSGVGGGFVDVGLGGTVAAPVTSTSLYEDNHAFMNGVLTVHNGVNGNYNILYNGSYTLFPIVNGSISGGFPTGGYPNPNITSFPFALWKSANVSVIQ